MLNYTTDCPYVGREMQECVGFYPYMGHIARGRASRSCTAIIALGAVVLALAIFRTATTIVVHYPLSCLLKQLTVVEHRLANGNLLRSSVGQLLRHCNHPCF